MDNNTVNFAPKKLWQPSQERIQETQMLRFMRYIGIKNYPDLYRWSIQSIGEFWESIWKFCEVKSHVPYDKKIVLGKKFYDTQWFPGTQLNFAENLLKTKKESLAIISYDETGRRRTLSYHELHDQVAYLANALKKQGVKRNDRVAGYLPNIPETIIAMLATTSLGAVWSSCSPDFGVQGVIDRFEQIQPKVLFVTDGQFYNGKTHSLLDRINPISAQISSIEHVVVIPFVQRMDSAFERRRDSDEGSVEAMDGRSRESTVHTLRSDIKTIEKSILYADFITEDKRLSFEHVPFNHPLYILYSSGTTGKPKAIVHGVGGTLLQHLKELILHTDITKKDTFFYYTTCGWMMWNWMVSGLATGCTLVLYDGSPAWPKSSVLMDIVEKENVTVFGTSARYIASLQKEGLKFKETHDLSHLKCILSTGSPLSPNNFDYVYDHIKTDVQLSSISGGTDIVSCFALGNPILPVYRGQLQGAGLGLAVDVYSDDGHSMLKEKGELVCTRPFPCMPVYFWNDPHQEKYIAAYFSRFDNVWAQGDYAEMTNEKGFVIYGRSDTVLNPGGVRIGTAEIYRQVEKIDAILESVVVGQDWDGDIRVILFVKLRPDCTLDEALEKTIRATIRANASPRHVPEKIIQVHDIPRTISGKIAELAVRNTIHKLPVKNTEALVNPECLKEYEGLKALA